MLAAAPSFWRSGYGDTGELCSNSGGDVFITTEYAIYEYPHGMANPIAMLTDPLGFANGCSIDPTTGNLAATSSTGAAIYRPAGGNQWHLPRLFSFSSPVSFGGYDAHGNLFVDGVKTYGGTFFDELFKGASKFQAVKLNRRITTPGNIQWDGKFLAVGDMQNLLIHRFAISGTQGSQVGSVSLKGSNHVNQFWIQGSTLIGPGYLSAYFVGFWPYPKRGSTQKMIQQIQAYGATVSVAGSK